MHKQDLDIRPQASKGSVPCSMAPLQLQVHTLLWPVGAGLEQTTLQSPSQVPLAQATASAKDLIIK